MENTEVTLIVIYYAGMRTIEGSDVNYLYVSESGEELPFKKPLDRSHRIGLAYEVTRTEKGVRSPYKLLMMTPRHVDSTIWFAKNLACKRMRIAFLARSKKPEGLSEFETALNKVTRNMTLRQKHAFLMSYILDLK